MQTTLESRLTLSQAKHSEITFIATGVTLERMSRNTVSISTMLSTGMSFAMMDSVIPLKTENSAGITSLFGSRLQVNITDLIHSGLNIVHGVK